MREHAPVAKMLNWHALKQVTGQLMAAVPVRPSLVAATLLDLPAAQVDQALKDIEQSADEADLLRRRGLYVDISADGGIYEPRQVTEADLAVSWLSHGTLPGPPSRCMTFVNEP